MYAELLMCITQRNILKPYKFKLTGVKVFSLEEALYHTYYNWKDSYDDFVSDTFIEWVRDTLNLPHIALQISSIKLLDSLSEKIINFLSIIDYFDPIKLASLKAQILIWEKQTEWERLKNKGDYLIEKDNPELAYSYYKKALEYEKNLILYNNIGIACMKMEMFGRAVANFKKAYSLDKSNIVVIINLAESLIYKGDYEEALIFLDKAEKHGENSEVYYLYAKLYMETNNPSSSIDYLNKAINLQEDNAYFYMLSEAYIKIRKFQEALNTLNRVKNKDTEFYINESNIYASYNDYPAAVKSMEKALVFASGNNNIDIWTKLATYHRLNYELEKAELAINKALTMNPDYQLAKLEQAKIKKAQGKMKDYQKGLSNILEELKNNYRKNI